jgi:group I intron endonuclease
MPNINKDKKYHFIYKTTNLVNSKFYIGMHSTSNLNDGYIGSGKRLKRSIKKYGIENFKFEILEYCDSRELLAEREKYIVNQEMIDNVLCLNLKIGGIGGGIFTSEQAKLGRKAANKTLELKYGPNFKSIISTNWRLDESIESKKNRLAKVSKSLKGRIGTFKNKKHLETSKNKISLSNKGKGIKEQNSGYNTCWINKDGCFKKITKNDIELYLNNGWLKGRKGYKNNNGAMV